MLDETMLKSLLPLACAWAEEQEGVIARDGVGLTPSQLDDARRLGVAHPENIHLRVVQEIPLPSHPLLRQAAETSGLITPLTAGLTVRYGIFIHAESWGERRLVVHELAHTAQYERLGGFRPFLEQYLRECITPPGYPFGPLEQEAKRIEGEICGPAQVRNAIGVIAPYKYEGIWVFDDPAVGLVREPFVAGIDTMIDKLVASIPAAEHGFRLLFSATPFPGYTVKLDWRREEYGGNWYYSPDFDMEGWLCPALFKYFEKAPRELYGRAERKTH
jgi:hypothetical protein